MPDKVCPHCSSSLSINALFTAINPAHLKCQYCSASIRLSSPLLAWLYVLMTFMMSLGAFFYIRTQTSFSSLDAFVGLGIWAVLIVLFYAFILYGIVDSNLVDSQEDVKANELSSERNPLEDKIYPRIKHQNHIHYLREETDCDEDSMPIHSPLIGDLILCYAIDVGEHYESLSKATMSRYGISVAESALPDFALSNAIDDYYGDIELHELENGLLYQLDCPDHMVATSILVPELWLQIQEQLGGPVIVAFLHRDVVIFAKKEDVEGRKALQELVEDYEPTDNHALSRLFYCLEDKHWSVEKI